MWGWVGAAGVGGGNNKMNRLITNNNQTYAITKIQQAIGLHENLTIVKRRKLQ